MSEPFRTGLGTIIQVQVEPGDNGGEEKRFVHGLPEDVVGYLETMATALGNLQTYTDTLETLVAATNTALTTLQGHTDQLESKLDTLIARNPVTGVTGQNIDIDTGAEPVGSQACTVGAWVKNISSGTQKVSIKQGGTATMTDGYLLSVGDEHFFPCANISELSAIADAVNAAVSWHAL